MSVLIGSTAAKMWFPDFRTPRDVDYFVDGAGNEDTDYFYDPEIVAYFNGRNIAIPDELYTIKVSHAFWELRNGSWNKHMNDILFFQKWGCEIVDELYRLLYTKWETRYGKKKANLNATPEEFFNGRVERKYDHDSIHASVAYYDRPLFESILRDGSQVAVSRDKFEALDFDDKLKLVREEVYATALERVWIPRGGSPTAAYAFALKKTITSFSKGWFPLFIVDNYDRLRLPDVNYVQRFKDNQERLILL